MTEKPRARIEGPKHLPGIDESLQMPAHYILLKKDEIDREISYMQEDRERALNAPDEAREYAEDLAEAFDSSPEERDMLLDEFTNVGTIDEKIERHRETSRAIAELVEDLRRGDYDDPLEFLKGQLYAEEAVPMVGDVTPEYRERKAAELPALRRYVALLESRLAKK